MRSSMASVTESSAAQKEAVIVTTNGILSHCMASICKYVLTVCHAFCSVLALSMSKI